MIFTIGYSNKNIDTFIQKLIENNITLIIDVRSIPHSRNPQFNKAYFEKYLNNKNLNYIYMGDCLGGLEINHNFNEAIEEVVRLSEFQNLVLVCAEGEPKNCHRFTILTPAIESRSMKVEHLIWTKSENLSLF